MPTFQPLVSVVVTTYNSQSTILDTLISLKNQLYPNIELIVSDDASTDNSLEIVQKWLNKNKSRFIRTQLVTTPNNTGVSANCNRCISAANSTWIKLIAGDDILFPNCIGENVTFIEANPEAKIIFSQVQVFKNNFDPRNYLRAIPANFPNNLMHPDFSPTDQWSILVESDRITYTPSSFINRQCFLDVGGFDEEIKLQEDYPMWLKLTKAGYRLYYFHKPTVGYRQHDNALNNTHGKELFKQLEVKAFKARKKYAHPYLPLFRRKRENWVYMVKKLFLTMGWQQKSTPFRKRLLRLVSIHLNPWFYLDALQRRLLSK